MYSKFYSVNLYALIITILWFVEMVNCQKPKPKKYRITGSQEQCPSRNFAFFAIISTNIGTCGGILLDHYFVGSGKDCLEDIGATRCPECTMVKVGAPPYTQSQIAYLVGVFDDSSEVAVVKVRYPFTMNQHVQPLRDPISSECNRKPYFIFLPQEEVDKMRQPYAYHCARVKIMKQCPYDDYDPWQEDSAVICANATRRKPSRKERPVCDRTVAGPLMCGNDLLGFLMPESCACYNCNYLKFYPVMPDGLRRMMRKAGRRNEPSPKSVDPAGSADDEDNDGKSVHGSFQTKVFTTAMVVSIYMAVY